MSDTQLYENLFFCLCFLEILMQEKMRGMIHILLIPS